MTALPAYFFYYSDLHSAFLHSVSIDASISLYQHNHSEIGNCNILKASIISLKQFFLLFPIELRKFHDSWHPHLPLIYQYNNNLTDDRQPQANILPNHYGVHMQKLQTNLYEVCLLAHFKMIENFNIRRNLLVSS